MLDMIVEVASCFHLEAVVYTVVYWSTGWRDEMDGRATVVPLSSCEMMARCTFACWSERSARTNGYTPRTDKRVLGHLGGGSTIPPILILPV